VGHGDGESFEIEIRHISFISLEVGVVPEEFIELVPPRLPFKKDIFTVGLELFLYFKGDSVRKNSFACSKFNVNELWGNEFVFKGLFCDQFGLKVVVCRVFYLFAGSAFDEV
jgi:hypothetical protein